MFGKMKGPASLALTDISKLSDAELYGHFADDSWNLYDKADRLRLLQEVENRRAKIDGRPPVAIRGAQIPPNYMGAYCEPTIAGTKQKIIILNDLFLGNNSLTYHSGMQALETVLHEGRHANQHYVKDNCPDRIARQVLHEWISSDAYYFSTKNPLSGKLAGKEFLLYTLQSIEMDARRFARRQLIQIYDHLAAQGKDTRRIVSIIQSCRQREIELIDSVRSTLDEDDIREAERIVFDRMKETHPDIDTSNLRLFDNARLILKLFKTRPDLDYDDVIDRLDRIADAKLDRLPEEEIAKIAEGRDRIWDARRRLDRI